MRKFVGVITLASLISFNALAKKKDYDFSGRIGLGLLRDELGQPEKNFEMRLQAESPRKEGLKGVLEVRSDEDTRTVFVNEAFGDYRNEKKTKRVRFGRGKKAMGWQWEYPTSTRLTINRAAPYSYLSERTLTGRDYFVSYVWLIKDEEPVNEEDNTPMDASVLTNTTYFDPQKLIPPDQRWKFELSAHVNESDDIALILNAIKTLPPHWRIGMWVLGQRMRSVSEVRGVWASALSFLYQGGLHRGSLEFFSGIDPYRTDVNRLYGLSETVHFSAVRAEYGVKLNVWNPYVMGSTIWKNLSQLNDRFHEGIIGLRYFITPMFNVAGEGMIRDHRAHQDITASSYQESSFKILGRYFF